MERYGGFRNFGGLSAERPRVTSDPDILSGRPRITGTRIPVSGIISFHLDGYSAAQIMGEYPGLSEADIAAALAYRKPKRA